MNIATRILAASIAILLVAAACGPAASTPVEPTKPAPVEKANEPVKEPVKAPEPVAAKHLILYGDTVRGTAGLTDAEKKGDQPQGLVCVVMSRFPHGSRIVWRIRVMDPVSNTALDDKALESVTLNLPDGKTQALKYGPHGGTKENPTDFFWVTGWTVPLDYPTGLFNAKVVATSKTGATGSFGADYFKVTSGQLQIIPADLGKRSY